MKEILEIIARYSSSPSVRHYAEVAITELPSQEDAPVRVLIDAHDPKFMRCMKEFLHLLIYFEDALQQRDKVIREGMIDVD